MEKKKGTKQGRGSENKYKIAIAVEKHKSRKTNKLYVGRIRLKVIENCGAAELTKFVEENVSIEAKVKTDKWTGYNKLKTIGYKHYAEKISDYETDFKGLHNVVSLIKRWILGTFQGKVSPKHIQKDLEEFTFRFNRKHFNLGVKFKRLLEYCINSNPFTYKDLVNQLETS